ncbi:hypothetical protein NGF19_02010 [Streptomyces sp. RY43-2]|uniref:Uncharacterized protein n=1 Tax=Streptomyces macrolidinus TaxID=2952607 RepID=A0ABT0Z726_9ACTN|nr:hypothetical protein [Streptomyces macrolidinus]
MPGNSDAVERQPPPVPASGALVVDADGRVGEFRGEVSGLWCLRPVTGGTTWTVVPEDTRPATPEQRIHADVARANARSRGEVL